MTREQLQQYGLTEEQIEKVIAENSKDVQSANSKTEKTRRELQSKIEELTEKAGNADELQAKLEEIEQGKLTEMEKIQKELEKSNNRVAELEKQAFIATQKTKAAEKFKITTEQAEKVVGADGTIDFDVLGQIISEKEAASALAKEQEIAAQSSNPGGGSASGGEDDGKTSAERIAEKHFGANKAQATNDIVSMYAK